jgi:C-terminal processing protease CtpA/Prc
MTRAAFDNKCYEGKGIPPDIDADLDTVAYQNGTDTQLECALQYITGSTHIPLATPSLISPD